MAAEVSILTKDFNRTTEVYLTKLEAGNYYYAVMDEGKLKWLKSTQYKDSLPLFVVDTVSAKAIAAMIHKEFQ